MSISALILKGEQEFAKIKNWFISKEPSLVQAIVEAHAITTAAIAWKNSPQGVGVVAFVEAQLPKSAPWFDEASKIAVTLCTDLAACSSKAGIEGVALRMGAEISSIIHGKKLPTGIAGYLAEFQSMFIG